MRYTVPGVGGNRPDRGHRPYHPGTAHKSTCALLREAADSGPYSPGRARLPRAPLSLLFSLRPLQARQYSISSSPLAHPDRIHLAVASVRYGSGQRRYEGVASTYLADRTDGEGTTVGVYVQPNASCGVPADDDAPMVMIGPGTGIAPFRGRRGRSTRRCHHAVRDGRGGRARGLGGSGGFAA
ncbi:hypothetical protein [Streptomyces sp. NPDC101455]|uniref:hypothetical protein n=1 Tax=Streptomyces sp. NPDC101455 TaxID=3366142 RepID=UPI003824CA30